MPLKYIVIDSNEFLVSESIKLPEYTVATLPTAANKTAQLIWVTDAITSNSGWSNSSLGAIALSNGSTWISYVDNLPLSTAAYYRSVSANTTLVSNNRQVEATATCIITLASAANCLLGFVNIKNNTASSFITINSASGETIDGATSITLPAMGSITLAARNNTTWFVV